MVGFDTGQPGAGASPNAGVAAAAGRARGGLRHTAAQRRAARLHRLAGGTRPLIVDVVQHAFNAAFRDWRFPRLHVLELAGLALSVSVLTPPVPMRFDGEADLLAQLRPGIDGLIIEDAGRRSLFLPSVWEEIRDPRQFLKTLKLKAGLAAEHFSRTFTARRFRSIEVKGAMGASTNRQPAEAQLAWTAYVGPAGRPRSPEVA